MNGLDQPRWALERMDEISERLRGRRLALFLDYDGTLTPIVRRPEDATLSEAMRERLRALARLCFVAIVSGRDRPDAESMVGVRELVYAGSHGFDIRGPDGLQREQEAARQALPELDQAERELREQLAAFDGTRVERKKFAVAVHYRELVREDDAEEVERRVDRVVQGHRGLRKKGGKKIFELQPDVDWDKGRAVLWLAETLGLRGPDVVIVYVGDDVTDEDAFQALRRQDEGLGIRVADSSEATGATYILRDCDQVEEFLERLQALLMERKADE